MSAAETSDDPAILKIVRMLGEDRGRQVVRETLATAGLESLASPDDRLRFGEVLVAKGGLLEAIGRSIKAQALLQGARTRR